MPHKARVALLFMLAGTVLIPAAQAGGGLVLRDDICVLQIGFYEAHFTAYQPNRRGNQEFCQTLPDVDETLFVLDYMHASLKDVTVDFRIIRDVTGLGEFVKVADVEALGDLTEHTVFYQSPVRRRNASLQLSHAFAAGGDYICVVSAGHPAKEVRYLAAFPVHVGGSSVAGASAAVAAAVLGALALLLWRRRRAATDKPPPVSGPV